MAEKQLGTTADGPDETATLGDVAAAIAAAAVRIMHYRGVWDASTNTPGVGGWVRHCGGCGAGLQLLGRRIVRGLV